MRDLVEVQREARDLLRTLEKRMEKLAGKLESEGRGEEAARLRRAVAALRDRNVAIDMGLIAERLEGRNLTGALEREQAVLRHMMEIVAELEGRLLDPRAFDEAVRRVGEARADLRALLGDAESALRNLRDAAASGEAARSVAEAKERIEALAKDQEALRDRPPQGPGAEERELEAALARIASLLDRQVRLRDRAGALAGADRALPRAAERALQAALARARALAEGLAAAAKGEAGEDVAKSARELAAEARKLAREAAGRGAVDPRLAERAADLTRAVEKGTAGAEPEARGVLEALEEAAAAAEGARTARRRLAGLASEQGELEAGARQEAAQAGRVPQGSPPRAAGARRDAAAGLAKAADAMAEAAGALQEGRRGPARDLQAKAAGSLERAAARMRQALDALRARTPGERAAARQEALARRAAGLERAMDGLRRKLGEEAGPVDRAREALGGAREAMGRAARKLASGGADAPRGEQDRAAQGLREAARSLAEAEEDRLERLRRDRLAGLEREQAALERRARELAGRFSAADQPEPVRRAGRHTERAAGGMGRAQDRLRAERPDEAARAGEEAVDDLRKAEEALARGEEELERLKQESRIASLVDELEAIRSGEEMIHKVTVEAEGRRSEGKLPRPAKLEVRQASERQQELRGKADGVREILEGEGAHAFAFVASEIGADMLLVVENLRGQDTGTYTQLLELGILKRIDALREALEKELENRRRRPPRQEQRPQGASRPRLVPPAAEVLLLKMTQEEINRETERIEAAAQARGGLTRVMERALERLAHRQDALDSTFRRMAGSLFGPAQGQPPEKEGGSSGEKKE